MKFLDIVNCACVEKQLSTAIAIHECTNREARIAGNGNVVRESLRVEGRHKVDDVLDVDVGEQELSVGLVDDRRSVRGRKDMVGFLRRKRVEGDWLGTHSNLLAIRECTRARVDVERVKLAITEAHKEVRGLGKRRQRY